MNKFDTPPPANVFADLQEGYSLIEDINAQIFKQNQKIEEAKEEIRQLKTDRNAYFAKFLKRAEEIRHLCEEYSHEMEQVSDEIMNNGEQLDKLRRKLTGEGEGDPDLINELIDDRTGLGLSADRRDLGTRRFPEVL